MSKKRFEVGDRVKVCASVFAEPIETNGEVTQIKEASGLLHVQFDKPSSIGNTKCWAHPRQCVKLKPRAKKEKREPRRVWVLCSTFLPKSYENLAGNNDGTNNQTEVMAVRYKPGNPLYKEFIELLPTRKLLSRQDVERVLSDAGMAGLYGFLPVLNKALAILGWAE